MARPRNKYLAIPYLIDEVDLGIMSQRVVVNTVNNFPIPVGGIITLADNTAYLINGTVDIGANRIVCGTRNAILGTDRLNDILTSSTTGALISVGPSDLSLLLNSVKITAPNGAIFEVISSGVSCSESSLSGASFGTFTTVGSLTFRQTAFLNAFTVGGATFTGAHTGTFRFFENTITNSAGTFLNFGASTFSLIDIERNLVTCNASQTFLSGQPANATFSGVIARNTNFAGAGTFATGIAVGDTNWLFTENVGISNDPVGGSNAWGDITGTLSNQTDLQTALNLKANTASLGTLATQNGTFSGTSSGTNTGDNATNTQYSGLAASKQDALVSGTNIKTINGSTLLGSGNIAISGGSGNFGKTTVDFGTFPGKSDTSVVVSGQTGITTASFVNAWVVAEATAEHSADEHILEPLVLRTGNIVDSTGFTIYAINANPLNDAKGNGTRLSGQFTVNWQWS